ncbi:MAG: GntR family transcriptional regulator [Lentisphaerae bacterium]|nr:MAG: GntR family transcriptional regulator [Lentisphaerota bacterium]
MSRECKYRILAERIIRQIEDGTWKAGDRLPAERELAQHYRVSRVTMRHALELLVAEDRLYRIRGAGTYVKDRSLKGMVICVIADVPVGGLSDNPFIVEVLEGVQDAVEDMGDQRNVELTVCLRRRNESVQILCPGLFRARRGAVFLVATALAKDDLELLTRHGIVVVSLGRHEGDVSYLEVDHTAGMRQAVSHLIRRHGCHRIGLLPGSSKDCHAQERIKGYRMALQESGLTVDEGWIQPNVPWDEKQSVEALRRLLERRPELDAVVVMGDWAAYGVLNWLHTAGIRVPQDLKLVGYDDFSWLQRVTGETLTAVGQPFRELGAEGIRTILEIAKAKKSCLIRKYYQPVLNVRTSCGCDRTATGD